MIWTAFACFLLLAAWQDGRTYRIPNWISLALVGLFVLALVSTGRPAIEFWPHLAAGAAVLLLGYLLFAVTGMGAGDAKLAASIVLWAGPYALYSLTFAFAVAMIVLAFGLVSLRRFAVARVGATQTPRLLQRGAPVPLGIALSAAALATTGSFNPALWSF